MQKHQQSRARRPLPIGGWFIMAALCVAGIFVAMLPARTGEAGLAIGSSTPAAVNSPKPGPQGLPTGGPAAMHKDTQTGHPRAAPTARPQAVPNTEMLGNPGFEEGSTVWTEIGPFSLIFTANDIPVHSGNWGAWLGGYHGADDQLYQNVTVPSNASAATLAFWFYSITEEASSGWDSFTLQIIDPTTGSHYVDAFTIDAYPPSNAWEFRSYNLNSAQLAAIRGKTVRVRFRVNTDSTLYSSFFIDDTSFNVSGGTLPTNTPTATLVATSTPTPTDNPMTILDREAENNVFTAPMQIGQDAAASACFYLYDPVGWTGTPGYATLTFSVSRSDNYWIWGRVMGQSWTENSFSVTIDGGSQFWYEVLQVNGQWQWGWQVVHEMNQPVLPFYLSSGMHTIRVEGREPDARLDRVLLVNRASYVPTQFSPCATDTPTPTPTATTLGGIRRLYAPWVGRQPTPTATATPIPTATPTPTTAPVCPQDPTEPNGSFAQAWGPLSLNQDFLGYFNCPYDTDRDYYFFDLVNRRRVIITLQNIPAGSDYDLALYSCASANCLAGYSGNTGTANEQIDVTVNAGRYYVRVTRSASSPLVAQPYRLRVSTP